MGGVYRFLLAPRWLALHVAVVAVGVAFALLGWWQLGSYRAEGLAPADGTAAEVAPVALGSLVGPGQPLPRDAGGRAVTVTGRYDAAQQLFVPGRELDGREGAYVLTPLLTAEGAVVPVRRGWVVGVEDPGVHVPSGPVTATGVLLPSEPERAARVRDDGQLPAGQLPYVATPELMRRWPYPPAALYEGYVALTAQAPGAAWAPTPVPVTAGTDDDGVSGLRNLSYAGQWWLFAGAALVFWVLAVRSAAGERRAAQTEDGSLSRGRTSRTTTRSA